MFRVDVAVEGVLTTTEQLVEQILHVMREVDEYEGADPPPIGIMTGDNRRTWAQNRQILIGGKLESQNLCERLFYVLYSGRRIYLSVACIGNTTTFC